ncbi:hypothetical protein ACQPZK_01290 [Micromonospora sp. CA-249363]|uniref:hypothetical protein n=1 Tax=Micromonospora sp. CA-249363 TaxID=3239963 RepID=UPI003D8C5E3D
MNSAFWAGIALGAIASLVVAELLDLSAWASPKVIRAAARRLPEGDVSRYEEEWMAELQHFDGLKLVKLMKALSIWRGSFALERSLQTDALRLPTYLANVARFISDSLTIAWDSRSINVEIEQDHGVVQATACSLIEIEFARLLLGPDAEVTCAEVPTGKAQPVPGQPGLYHVPSTVSFRVSGDATISESVILAAKFVQWIAFALVLLAQIRSGINHGGWRRLRGPSRLTFDRH